MAKKKKEFVVNEDGWISEVGELRVVPEPKYYVPKPLKPVKKRCVEPRKKRCDKPKNVSAALNEVEQDALNRLMKYYGENTSAIIRRSLMNLDQSVMTSQDENLKDNLNEGVEINE